MLARWSLRAPTTPTSSPLLARPPTPLSEGWKGEGGFSSGPGAHRCSRIHSELRDPGKDAGSRLSSATMRGAIDKARGWWICTGGPWICSQCGYSRRPGFGRRSCLNRNARGVHSHKGICLVRDTTPTVDGWTSRSRCASGATIFRVWRTNRTLYDTVL